MEALASALRSQADILASLISRLHPGASWQSEVDQGNAQPPGRRSGHSPRGQLPATAMVDRESRSQDQSGGDQDQKRRI
ncbi:hypothetical protein CVS40_11091 [Lucilia cuprina]|nr:hypothetical protein CVS40_11091 [Lucilia cuprina]